MNKRINIPNDLDSIIKKLVLSIVESSKNEGIDDDMEFYMRYTLKNNIYVYYFNWVRGNNDITFSFDEHFSQPTFKTNFDPTTFILFCLFSEKTYGSDIINIENFTGILDVWNEICTLKFQIKNISKEIIENLTNSLKEINFISNITCKDDKLTVTYRYYKLDI